MRYIIDSDVFIEAKKRHYQMDICPAFWDWLVDGHARGIVHSVEAVYGEIQVRQDELAAWSAERGKGFFLSPDAAVASRLGDVSRWATSQSYTQSAVNTFLGAADYFLISHAVAHGCTVVSLEVREPVLNRIKVPNACDGLGVKCINPYDMLRAERVRFVLAT